MSVKVEIFSGFLGAGKTQLIKKLIEEGYYKEKIAIIENEFGEVSIDGEVLKRTNTLVKEINAGCICCQVTGDFKESIIDVVESCNVDRLLIEPTGVAKLSDIKKVFAEKELKDVAQIEKAITVVDAEKFDLYLANFKSFFMNQIKNANIIILSRTQNVKGEELRRLNEEINKLNSNAIIVGKEWSRTKSEELIPKAFFLRNINDKNEKVKFKKGSLNVGNIKKEKNEEAAFESFALKIDRNVSKEELLSKFNFIKNSFEFGEIIRAKGIVNTKNGKEQFDYTLSEINMEKIAYRGETIISFIISANNNIPRIKKIIERLSQEYGNKIFWNGNEYFTFPTPEQLAKASIEDLRSLGLGFRDKRVYKTTQMILNKEVDLAELQVMNDSNKIREELLKLDGVGEKVADCIMLFSLKKYDVFPIDVWVRRVMNDLYIHNENEEKVSKKELQKLAQDKFLGISGLAQQYLFYWRREKGA